MNVLLLSGSHGKVAACLLLACSPCLLKICTNTVGENDKGVDGEKKFPMYLDPSYFCGTDLVTFVGQI